MSDELVVLCCSPTLAGMKTGSVFSCDADSEDEYYDTIRLWNRRLGAKGLRFLSLRYRDGRGLVYVFRPSSLRADLEAEKARTILCRCGYGDESMDSCISRLSSRLNASGDFPHELGLFLGYPPDDVSGFIEHHAADFLFSGQWKVYGNLEAAKKTFAKFRKCSDIFMQKYTNGTPIEDLAVCV